MCVLTVAALGGTFVSGPTSSGGWMLSAVIPAAVPDEQPVTLDCGSGHT
jgi:hypothetical protein